MRIAFLLLVVANLAFFAWSRYAGSEAAAEGMVVRRHEPDKLKIVPPAELGAAPLACLELGAFTPLDYPRAEKALEALGLGGRMAQRRAEQTAGWWVFIPSQGSRLGALKKAAELKALGIEDYYIMGEDADAPFALSLGVFRTEQAALARLAALRDLGVRTALVGSRDTVLARLWLQVKGLDPALEPRLREVAREFEGSVVKPCPPPVP